MHMNWPFSLVANTRSSKLVRACWAGSYAPERDKRPWQQTAWGGNSVLRLFSKRSGNTRLLHNAYLESQTAFNLKGKKRKGFKTYEKAWESGNEGTHHQF